MNDAAYSLQNAVYVYLPERKLIYIHWSVCGFWFLNRTGYMMQATRINTHTDTNIESVLVRINDCCADCDRNSVILDGYGLRWWKDCFEMKKGSVFKWQIMIIAIDRF